MNTLSLFNELIRLISLTGDMDVKAFGQGCSRKDIESMIKIHPIPESLMAIYSRVRGIPNRDNNFLMIGWHLLAIDEINEQIDMLTEYGAVGYYQPDMIPFLDNGCGDCLSVRTLKHDQSVWYLMHDDEGRMVHRSIDDFLLTVIECYKQGVYFYNGEEKLWDFDYDLCMKIGRELNPGIEFRPY